MIRAGGQSRGETLTVALSGFRRRVAPGCFPLVFFGLTRQTPNRSNCQESYQVKNLDPKKLAQLAEKNRLASQKRYEEETKKPSIGATKKRRKELEEQAPDPKWEGADRLFQEMKKKDRK